MRSKTNSHFNLDLSNPIFIMGIMRRSGTNYLYDLLDLHPDCSARGPIFEDYLLAGADLLVNYANNLYKYWNPNWEVNKKIGSSDLICEYLGKGLISFLNLQLKESYIRRNKRVEYGQFVASRLLYKRLVTKTPS